MTIAESRRLKTGLYIIVWKDGKHSRAAIGMCKDGTRWVAPVNWVAPTRETDVWRRIERVELVLGVTTELIPPASTERHEKRRQTIMPSLIDRTASDVITVLPLLNAEFTSSDVGRVMWTLGRKWTEHQATLNRLVNAGHVVLKERQSRGTRFVNIWTKCEQSR